MVLAIAASVGARADAQEPAPIHTPWTVTVAAFDTDRTARMPPPGLGVTLAELLASRLVTAGAYRVVDLAWLTREGDASRRTPFDVLLDRAAGAGIDYLIQGSLTRLSIERRSSSHGGVLPVPLVGALVRKQNTEFTVGLSIRVICVRTGEVVATSVAESGATEHHTSGGGLAVVGAVPLIGGSGSTVTGSHDRLLDEAVQQAVAAAAHEIVAALGATRQS
jgi:curli biogenesis system outer membrane secretion channel CsgG